MLEFDFHGFVGAARAVWPWVAGTVALVVAVVASAHVILNKRDVRAAIGWTGLILLSPLVGAVLYYLLGINRIQRRAARLTAASRREGERRRERRVSGIPAGPIGELPENLRVLNRTVETVTRGRLIFDNAVTPLVDGDAAFPDMLAAIDAAEHTVCLASYIFDHDAAGAMFVDALAAAVRRGVLVRTLVDGVGARYSRPRITRALVARGVPAAEFLPSRLPWRNPYMNLRNHRKLLIVDQRRAYTGGLNIREGCLLARPSAHPVRDLHFRLEGPVVNPIFAAFAEDWWFTTGEELQGEAWTSRTRSAGAVLARAIVDGPDEDFETIPWTLQAALSAARHRVRIMTPYFLPEPPLLASLQLAAMRGLAVEILLPERSNLRFVQWATMAGLGELLRRGCRVWLTPPPFDHSKAMVVDDAWSLIGSANWDARSLRLNFELDVECYDEALAAFLLRHTDEKLAHARELKVEEVDERSLPVRLRDGVTRLFSPYL